jgi:putative ABC transport system permease protein
MKQDLRHGLRLLLRQPAFSLTAILTLALGVGANAAVFAVAWHLLLKPLPWPDADRVVQIWNVFKKTGQQNVLAPANFFDIERESQQFAAVAAYNFFPYSLNLTDGGDPVELKIRAVTAGYFDVFGVGPLVGRTFTADETREGRDVVVISEAVWRTRFAADHDIAGRAVNLDGRTFEIIGVMPASFEIGTESIDGYTPFGFEERQREMRVGYYLAAVGRIRPGVSTEAAQGELATIAARAGTRFPSSNENVGLALKPMREELTAAARSGIVFLMGAAALVLLIACANVTSLLFARATGRQRELAVRAALGASRSRLLRLLLAESLVIAVVSGYAGLIAGLWTVRSLTAVAPPSLAIGSAYAFEPIVLAYVLILSIVAGLVLAIVPAWRATRPPPSDALRSRSGSDRGSQRLRALLVGSEVALATILLVGATLLVASMTRLLNLDPGFRTAGIVAANLRLPPARYENLEQRTVFFEQVFERLRGAAGVETVCATNAVPLETTPTMTFVPEATTTLIGALPISVSDGCFAALDIQVLRGRPFANHEPLPVAIVSQSFARRAFRDVDPLGRTIRVGIPTGLELTVIGVVEDTRHTTLEAPSYGQVYQLATQEGAFFPNRLLVRASGPLDPIVAALQASVKAVDPSQPVSEVRTLDSVAARSLSARRFNVGLLGGFAAIALVLAAIGIYGLLAELVAQRRGEIGVRVALGAKPASIVRLITASAMKAVVIGIAAGCATAWALSAVLRRFAYGVSPTEPWLYAGAAAVLTAAALCAAAIPSRRAARIDPAIALRAE